MQRSFPSVVRSTPTPRNEPALTDQRTPPSLRTLYVWHLAPYGVDAELIPTERCALIRASFAKPDVPGFFFDIPGEHPPDIHQDAARRTTSFTSTANSGGVPDNFATYYVLQFSEHWKTVPDVLPLLKKVFRRAGAKLMIEIALRLLEG